MGSKLRQQPVRLADLEAFGERGFFIRRPGESTAEHAARLMQNDAQDCNEPDKSKVLRYASALARGDAQFPPLLVFDDGDSRWVGDGHHRAAAAGWLGQKTLPAIVLDVGADEGGESDDLLSLFYDAELNGTPTREALEMVAFAHSFYQPAGAH